MFRFRYEYLFVGQMFFGIIKTNQYLDVAVECQDDEGVQIEEQKDSAHGDRNESSEKSGQPEDSVPHDTTTITSKFSFIRQGTL